MLFLDAVLYSLLAWYLDLVLPSEFGVPRPWYFIFAPKFWLGLFQRIVYFIRPHDVHRTNQFLLQGDELAHRNNDGDDEEFGVALTPLSDDEEETVQAEPLSPDMQQQISNGRALRLRKLRKVFTGFTGGDVIAVHSLNLDLFEGQVNVLLGHNGAGKSTTISMLTGLIPPTSGNAFLGAGNSQHTIIGGKCDQHKFVVILATAPATTAATAAAAASTPRFRSYCVHLL
jgi:ATP-binding cassette subfamily A (ABC1) protein 3